MPDELHIPTGSHSLRSIARTTYNLSGTGARARERAALAALVRANPHLEESATVPAGAVLVIPEVTGVERNPEPRDRAAPEVDSDRRAELGRMREAITEAGKELAAGYRKRSAKEKRNVEVLKKHGGELIGLDSSLRRRIPEWEDAFQARLESLKSESAAMRSKLKELAEGVEVLDQVLKDRGSALSSSE